QGPLIARLGRVRADDLTIVERLDVKPRQAATIVLGSVECYLPLAGMIDLDAERIRLQKELAAAEADVARREAKLANEGFVARAPAAIVEREREGLATARVTLATLQARLADL
ncbi:MAG: valine--tRNA ligase, partial [Chloroflexia bacterium]|nr:valine--tRNA ligase [Chloroflexia bacterium]